MRQSSSTLQHGGSLPVYSNGRKTTAAVAPVSALELFRIGVKRRRGTGMFSGGGNSNGSSSNNRIGGFETYNEYSGSNRSTRTSLSSSVSAPPLCLLQNPHLSLPIGLSELAGPAGAGKTQMALSLCADCVQYSWSDNNHQKKKAVYIQLGGSSRFLQTASRRLKAMLESRIAMRDPCGGGIHPSGSPGDATDATAHNPAARHKRHHHRQRQRQQQQPDVSEDRVHDCLSRIIVHWICNSEDLMELLRTKLPRLLRMNNRTVSLVVLDGIANLFRLLPEQDHFCSTRGYDIGDKNPWHHRAVTFFQISNLCKELSSVFEVPFVVLNECTSRISSESTTNSPVLEPAMGLAWSQCVNCSFFICRESRNNLNTAESATRTTTSTTIAESIQTSDSVQVCRRVLQCLRASHISSEYSRAEFWIDRSGVHPYEHDFGQENQRRKYST